MARYIPTPRSRVWRMAGILAALVAVFFLWQRFSSDAGKARTGMPAVPVRVAEVMAEDMPRTLDGLGTVQASGSVLVRSRVDGQLMKLHFTEGHKVKAGDLLAEIDPRPFQNSLHEAQGQLERDKALLENARRDLTRYAQLSKGDFIPEQQLESQRSMVRQYEGVVRSDEAQVASAALQVEYSRIEAPMSGVLGLKQVDVGTMIRATDTNGIVRITETQPSDVLFTLPESDLPDVLAGQREAAAAGERLPVQAFDREQKRALSLGYLLSIDNQIDTATGTVKLKARFANADETLFPNQFVNARLRVRVRKNATVVPASAVQLGAQGSFVYVIDRENKARMRKVTPGWRAAGRVVLEEGVTPGERVVVDGVDRLRDDMPVTVPGESPTPREGGKPAK